MTVKIYVLKDERFDNELHSVRYVGQTRLPLSDRLRMHRRDALALKENNRRVRWLTWMCHNKLPVSIVEIADVSLEEANDAERQWIAYFYSVGCDLVNATDGGRAATRVGEETRQKHRDSWLNPDIRKRRIEAAVIRQSTAEERKRISIQFKKMWQDPEMKDRLLTIIRDPANRLSRSVAFKTMWQDSVKRQRIRDGQEAYIRSDIGRQNISEHMKAKWADEKWRSKTLDSIRRVRSDPEWRKRRGELSRQWILANYTEEERKAAMSRLSSNAWNNPDQRLKLLEARALSNAKPEVKQKRSEHTKSLWANPETRAKIMLGKLAAIAKKKEGTIGGEEKT